MTAPSNANTSGLEAVDLNGLLRQAWHRLHRPEADVPGALLVLNALYVAIERPIVTAASAQARIAELEADIRFRNERWNAAEARADRLAATTADIVLALRGFIVSLPDDLCERSDAFTELTEALERAAPASPLPGGGLPADVVRLVIAARRVAYEGAAEDDLRALDIAAEAFASRVPWDDEPDEIPAAPTGEPK